MYKLTPDPENFHGNSTMRKNHKETHGHGHVPFLTGVSGVSFSSKVSKCQATSCAVLALQDPSGPQTKPIWHLQIFGRPTPVVMQSAPKPHEVSASMIKSVDMTLMRLVSWCASYDEDEFVTRAIIRQGVSSGFGIQANAIPAGKATASLENAFQNISHCCFPWLWLGVKMSHQWVITFVWRLAAHLQFLWNISNRFKTRNFMETDCWLMTLYPGYGFRQVQRGSWQFSMWLDPF